MKIEFLHNDEIDFSKWDHCIEKSFNGNVYAFSWYLDISYPNWKALVMGDYEAIIPLFVNKKLKFEYIFRPIFSGRIAIYSNDLLSAKAKAMFWKKIQLNYFAVRLNLSFYTKEPEFTDYSIFPKPNYLLDTTSAYENLQTNFSDKVTLDIVESKKEKNFFVNSLLPNKIVDFALKSKIYTESECDKIKLICTAALRRSLGQIYGAYDSQNILGAAVFVVGSHQTRDFLFATCENTAKGKKILTSLIDHCLNIHADKNVTFVIGEDAGNLNSDIALGFGFKESFVNEISFNRLPWYAKSIKL